MFFNVLYAMQDVVARVQWLSQRLLVIAIGIDDAVQIETASRGQIFKIFK